MSSFGGFDYRHRAEGDSVSCTVNNHPSQDVCEPCSGRDFNHPPPVFGENGGEPMYAIHPDYREPIYVINVRILILALIVLLIVVLLVIFLHVYVRWFWGQSVRFSRQRSASRRRRFHLTVEEQARPQNVGLDSAILETLPMFLYKPQNFIDTLECAVCLCELKENEKARLLPNCRHSFHVDCIDMWFLSHSTCPLCRTDAQPEQPVSESARIDQVSSTIPGSIISAIHDNLNSEQRQTASSGQEDNLLIQEHPRFSGDPA